MSNGNIEANNISSEIIETRGIIVTDTGTFKKPTVFESDIKILGEIEYSKKLKSNNIDFGNNLEIGNKIILGKNSGRETNNLDGESEIPIFELNRANYDTNNPDKEEIIQLNNIDNSKAIENQLEVINLENLRIMKLNNSTEIPNENSNWPLIIAKVENNSISIARFINGQTNITSPAIVAHPFKTDDRITFNSTAARHISRTDGEIQADVQYLVKNITTTTFQLFTNVPNRLNVNNGDILGKIEFKGYDNSSFESFVSAIESGPEWEGFKQANGLNSNFHFSKHNIDLARWVPSASVRAVANINSNQVNQIGILPSNLIFSTRPYNQRALWGSPIDRMIIDSNGKIIIGKPTVNNRSNGLDIDNLPDNDVTLLINSNDALGIPSGTEADKPSNPTIGSIRYNTTFQRFEGYGISNINSETGTDIITGNWEPIGSIVDFDGNAKARFSPTDKCGKSRSS